MSIYTNEEPRSIKATIQYLLNAVRSLLSTAGTVTSVSVTTANGVSGSVATATTTPAISLTLGAITPSTVNGVTLSGSSSPTLAVTGTTAVSGTNTGDQTNISGNAATVTTNANLTGPIASTGNTTSVTAQTGTGSTFVMQASPTLTTPNIGVATGTSLSTTGGVNNLYYKTVNISSADILAMNSSPKELVAAPGAGFIIRYQGMTITYVYNTTPYTIGASMTFNVQWAAGSNAGATSPSTGFWDQSANATLIIPPNSTTITPTENTALVLKSAAANLTGGDGTAVAHITYWIDPIP